MTYLIAEDSLNFIKLLDMLNVGGLSFENKDFDMLNTGRLSFENRKLVLV